MFNDVKEPQQLPTSDNNAKGKWTLNKNVNETAGTIEGVTNKILKMGSQIKVFFTTARC